MFCRLGSRIAIAISLFVTSQSYADSLLTCPSKVSSAVIAALKADIAAGFQKSFFQGIHINIDDIDKTLTLKSTKVTLAQVESPHLFDPSGKTIAGIRLGAIDDNDQTALMNTLEIDRGSDETGNGIPIVLGDGEEAAAHDLLGGYRCFYNFKGSVTLNLEYSWKVGNVTKTSSLKLVNKGIGFGRMLGSPLSLGGRVVTSK